MAKNSAAEGTLGALHDILAQELIKRIQSGLATAADLSAARGFLKDNDITCRIDDGNALGELQNSLKEQGSPVPQVEDSTLQAALDNVMDLEQYRSGGVR
ncbi:hypothetical protein [Xanthomonas phage SB4]|uniref:Terminase small subunit n=1 Tax=Xanthomonas phage SB4 TaxID=3117473 RepID=A0ABZ2GVQ0_9CAUD